MSELINRGDITIDGDMGCSKWSALLDMAQWEASNVAPISVILQRKA